ncbi:hypothetical protein E1180_21630 [Roseibium denhamense]|uniref:Autotransporter secretion inner membrane protein TamB n=1 Tax=Roseibium denhamense TaxID=76305 RepID=A0ABY1NTE3_9HYPH|nr:translocation/assembly module TamB domain-containing protein [Roseibium denhamense]MTI08105.1 hypothetical protein [Roseibium denhamense]SMP16455.1 autotransporter secretion inner membrane protein TamB [Roseibium denhamense]
MRLLSLFLRILAFLTLAAVFIPVATIAVLQVPAGRTFVSNVVSTLASTDTLKIEISDLYLSFGLNASVAKVALSDQEGVWLELDQAAVTWSPAALLAGEIDVETITAQRIDLNRTPTSSGPEDAPQKSPAASAGGVGVPFDIRLESLSLNEINIGPAVLGDPVSLSITGAGALALDPALLSARLDATRIDGVAAGLTANAEFDPSEGILAFDIKASEPRNGLAAKLLDLPDLPALTLDLSGKGPLTDWAADLDLALDGRTTVTGSATLREDQSERRLEFDLDGDLEPLAPPVAQAFLLGTTKAKGTASFTLEFAPKSVDLNLTTRTVQLAANGSIADGVVKSKADVTVGAGSGSLIALDLPDRRLAAGQLSLAAEASGPLEAVDFTSNLSLETIQTTEGRTGPIRLDLSGNGADFRPESLRVPFDLSLAIKTFEGLVPATKPLTGDISLTAGGTANAEDQSIDVSALTLDSRPLDASLAETTLSAARATGNGTLRLKDLSSFSELAGRSLGGTATTDLAFDLDPSELAGTLAVGLTGNSLAFGVPQADALFEGRSTLDTQLDLNGLDNITIETLSLKTPALQADGTVAYSPDEVAADLNIILEDLARIDSQVAGALAAKIKTNGALDALGVDAELTSKQILLAGTPLDDLKLSAQAVADIDAPTATLTTTASLNGQPIAVDVELSSKDGGADLNPLSITLAGNTIKGSLAVGDLSDPVQTLSGQLDISAPDLGTLSPLALTELGGSLTGTLLANPDDKTLRLDLAGADIEIPSVSVSGVKLHANVAPPFTTDTLSADIEVTDIITDVSPIHTVKVTAVPDDGGTQIDADIKLDSGSEDGLTMSALFSQPDSASYQLRLADLALVYQGLQSRLTQPATLTYAGQTAQITPLELQLGSGSLSVSGTAGADLDLSAKLNDVPLNLANAFVPSLGLGGTLSGTATASGSSSAPEAAWSLTGAGLTAAQMQSNGLAALSLTSNGTLANNTVTQTTRVDDPNGLNLTASGTVGLNAPTPLSLSLEGAVPFAALRRPLIEAGLSGEGTISVSGTVAGTASSPAYQITATPSGLRVTSLSTGLTVQNLTGSVAVTQDQASLNGIAGELSTGGRLTAGGTVSMSEGNQANLSVNLSQGRYIDPGLVTAIVSADISVSGPLASPSSSALIGGTVTIEKADVSIPESLPGAIPPVDVQHINASSAILKQVAALGGGGERTSQSSQKSVPPRLDVLLSAPGRIFVRGRGLDAELQGNLKIVGTTADPQAIGSFSLKRGQLDILTRRLTFSRGNATFEGSLTPVIDFAATTSVSDTTITVSVSGQADDPQISFTSSPELPQDEVLALLLFGKSVGNLSATQVARLAAAIATLTGGSDSGPLAQIRKGLGLDAIDINTDGDNGPSLAVGKYINDNIYLGVEQGTGSDSSRVQVDIDLDRGLKVRGEVGADGESKAGIFFEREY